MNSRKFLSPESLRKNFPLHQSQTEFIDQSRATIKAILDGRDSRQVLFIGPCSIHDITGFMTYANWLKKISEEFADRFFIVLRSHLEKPRTSLGWKGYLHDPFLDGTCDIDYGFKNARKLLIELANLQIPLSTEFVNPLTANYFGDLFSFAFVGARTVCSPVHRQLGASLKMPLGFKNTLEGNSSHAINAIREAAVAQNFLGVDNEGQAGIIHAKGNPDSILVLRGGEKTGPNYHLKDIKIALQCLQEHRCPLRAIIDCAHGNSQKSLKLQPEIFLEVIQFIADGEIAIKGLMLESYIKSGSQPLDINLPPNPEISITDPCIDIPSTYDLLTKAYDHINLPLPG